VMNGVEQLVRF